MRLYLPVCLPWHAVRTIPIPFPSVPQAGWVHLLVWWNFSFPSHPGLSCSWYYPWQTGRYGKINRGSMESVFLYIGTYWFRLRGAGAYCIGELWYLLVAFHLVEREHPQKVPARVLTSGHRHLILQGYWVQIVLLRWSIEYLCFPIPLCPDSAATRSRSIGKNLWCARW